MIDRMRPTWIFALPLLALACSSSDDHRADVDASTGKDAGVLADAALPDAPEASSFDAAAIVAERPYTLHVPASYDASKPTPLVVMFHGYGATAAIDEAVLKITSAADAHGFLYAYGEGTVDSMGNQYWNATDACCSAYGSPVDDVAYFDAIVDDVSAKKNVDPKRVFVIGHSNGAFMAHRLACERASRVAAIMALAGDVWSDASKCAPSEHVSVLQVHGDADMTILYGGGPGQAGMGTYPSAHASVATWAAKNGCTGSIASGAPLDLDSSLAGAETQVESYGGCPSGVDVELWTIQGGGHIPSFSVPAWPEAVWGFLSAHPKP